MPYDPLPKQHDALFRHAFGRPTVAASFFDAYLAPEIVAAVDWAGLELLPGTYVDETLRQCESDLLYRAPMHNRAEKILLYLLFEHQSSRDPDMPLRILRYLVAIWTRLRAEHPAPALLPPIVPLVLAQVAGGWDLSPHFHRAIQWPEDAAVAAALRPGVPAWEYTVVDLGATDPARLRGDVVVRAFLGMLHAALGERRLEYLNEIGPMMVEFLQATDAPAMVRALCRYALAGERTAPPGAARAALAQLAWPPQAAAIAMTYADEILEEGIETGIERGRAEGVLLGRIETLQQLSSLPVQSREELLRRSPQELAQLAAELEAKLRVRWG